MLRALFIAAVPALGLTLSAGATTIDQGEATDLADKTTPAFACTAQTEGQLTCQANKQCSCVFRPGEAGTGLPGRWAWDCGVMRPRCAVTPAGAGDGSYALPPVIIEHEDDNDDEGGG